MCVCVVSLLSITCKLVLAFLTITVHCPDNEGPSKCLWEACVAPDSFTDLVSQLDLLLHQMYNINNYKLLSSFIDTHSLSLCSVVTTCSEHSLS